MASASDLGTSSGEGSLPPFDKFLSNVGKGALIRSSDGSSPLTSEQRGTIRAGLNMEIPNPTCNDTPIGILSAPAQGVPLSEDDYYPSPQRSFSKASDQGTINEEGDMDEDPVDLEGETEISDIMVRSVELDIALAQQKLKNMLDTKAHQDRIKKVNRPLLNRSVLWGLPLDKLCLGCMAWGMPHAFGHDSTKCKQKPEDTDQTWTRKRVPSIGDVPYASSESCEASRAIREVTQGLDNVITRFAALQEDPNAEASNSLDNPESTSEGPLVQTDTSGFPEAECLGTISPPIPGDPPEDIASDSAQQCQSFIQACSPVRVQQQKTREGLCSCVMHLPPKDKKGLLDTALGSDKGHYGRLTVEKKSEPTPVPKGLDAEPTLPDDGEEASAIGQ
ncbi:hypothetical protein U1Q18_040503, partial [Sarracenia purpurea var. burkii]